MAASVTLSLKSLFKKSLVISLARFLMTSSRFHEVFTIAQMPAPKASTPKPTPVATSPPTAVMPPAVAPAVAADSKIARPAAALTATVVPALAIETITKL